MQLFLVLRVQSISLQVELDDTNSHRLEIKVAFPEILWYNGIY